MNEAPTRAERKAQAKAAEAARMESSRLARGCTHTTAEMTMCGQPLAPETSTFMGRCESHEVEHREMLAALNQSFVQSMTEARREFGIERTHADV
jgi:hypothetical protein